MRISRLRERKEEVEEEERNGRGAKDWRIGGGSGGEIRTREREEVKEQEEEDGMMEIGVTEEKKIERIR